MISTRATEHSALHLWRKNGRTDQISKERTTEGKDPVMERWWKKWGAIKENKKDGVDERVNILNKEEMEERKTNKEWMDHMLQNSRWKEQKRNDWRHERKKCGGKKVRIQWWTDKRSKWLMRRKKQRNRSESFNWTDSVKRFSESTLLGESFITHQFCNRTRRVFSVQFQVLMNVI